MADQWDRPADIKLPRAAPYGDLNEDSQREEINGRA